MNRCNGLAYFTGSLYRTTIQVACTECKEACFALQPSHWCHTYIEKKSNGTFIYPTLDLLVVAETADSVLQQNWSLIEKLSNTRVTITAIKQIVQHNYAIPKPSCNHQPFFDFLEIFIPKRFKIHTKSQNKNKKKCFGSKSANES